MRTELAAAFLVATLMGTTAVYPQSQPSAVEIFELRTKCSQLADNFFQNTYGKWSNQNEISAIYAYNKSKNRCYIQSTYRHDNTKISIDDIMTMTTIWDVQKHEIVLDYWDMKNGKKGGSIYDPKYPRKDNQATSYSDASEYAEELMTDDY